MEKIKAAFLDRDGTLIKYVKYLSSLSQIEIMCSSLELCVSLQKNGYKLFVVTNQSGIAKGYFEEKFVQETHDFLYKLLKEKGVIIEKFYYCPHHPTEAVNKKYLSDCDCRKPKPGMLLNAARDFNIDLSKSLMFGDQICDIFAGMAAGCKSYYISEAKNEFDKFKSGDKI